jgi:flagellar hook capping protein FlgD
MSRLAPAAITLALIGGAAAAFVWTQERKLDEPLVSSPKIENFFSPVCRCETKQTATLAVTLREPDRVDAYVVDGAERRVRTLARGRPAGSGRLSFEWDGRTDAGARAPDGQYRLELRLLGQDREGVIPNPVTLDTRPARAELLSAAPRVLEPGGRVLLRFRSSERSRPILLVDGKRAARRKVGDPGRRAFAWRGTARGRPVRSGLHRLAIQVRDRAGNLSRPTRSVRVRVR